MLKRTVIPKLEDSGWAWAGRIAGLMTVFGGIGTGTRRAAADGLVVFTMGRIKHSLDLVRMEAGIGIHRIYATGFCNHRRDKVDPLLGNG